MRLKTSRLVLREARPQDVAALAAYQKSPRYLEHYRLPPDPARIIEEAMQWAAETPRENFQFMLSLADGPAIGCAGLRQRGCGPGEAEVGIELDPERWGSGLAHEALSALFSFASRELSLSSLTATTAASNQRAQRLLLGLGFAPEPAGDGELAFRLRLPAPQGEAGT